MMDMEALKARVQRAFGDRKPADIERDYRAIVGPARTEDETVQAALTALANGQQPTPLQLAELEHAIRIFRPVIASRARVLQLPEVHRPIFPAWDKFSAAVKPYLYAIGRIDRGPKAPTFVPENVGTGFLIAPTALVTNRHVLELLSLGGLQLERGMAVVNFRQERSPADGEPPVAIVGVLAIHPDVDLVLLEIDAPADLPGRTPLLIAATRPAVGDPIVALGYPFADSERNPLFVDTLFEGYYGVKRASPGEVIALRRKTLDHDASTLGGNSGSPVLDMATAQVVGVHSRGGFAVRNTAVDGALLAELAAPYIAQGRNP